MYSQMYLTLLKSINGILNMLHAKLLQLSLSDPMDYSPPGFSVQAILQARILEWVAMPSSRGSSWPRDRSHVSYMSCISKHVLYPGTVCLFHKFHINELIQYVDFCVWHLSFSIVFLCCIHVVACTRTSFPFMANYYSNVYIYHSIVYIYPREAWLSW